MKVLDLFSGIGGFSLGLERAGMRTVAFCEIEAYPRRVLAKHWPEVPCYDDVRTLTAERLAADGIAVDVICGGFPCQDISSAGKGVGIDGARSGLWREFSRLIGECRPAWVLVENSPVLRTRGADRVFGDLEANGYAWASGVVGAAHAGAPHRRGRVFILAHADRKQHEGSCLADGRTGAEVVFANADCFHGKGWSQTAGQQAWAKPEHSGWWAVEPNVDRVAARVPARVDRLRALGNAVVPAIPEMIGRAIMALSGDQNEKRPAPPGKGQRGPLSREAR